ncbi:alpha-crystallin B chain-like [Amphiura filiformis]|uniref:alpha-crystallin B chain-like n=1 Tax=Amphiura filiformis TaxID=82378 RepID=UPI003B21859A
MSHGLFHGPMFPPPPPPPFAGSPYGHHGFGHHHHGGLFDHSPFGYFGGFGNSPPPPSPRGPPPPPPTPGPVSDAADHHHQCPYIQGWWQNAQTCPYLQRQRSTSQVEKDKDKDFKVTINVSQFAPEDLNVTVVDGHVQIIGKHEERKDDHGFITREFTRRYLLPDNVDPSTVKSSLAQGGVLTVSAPKKQSDSSGEVREVPIAIEPPPIDDDKKES